MVSHFLSISNSSSSSPEEMVRVKEFISGLYKAGSLISMLENKKINSTTLFLLLLENKNYQDFFTEITSSNNFKDALLALLYLYPNLVKSKFTKTALKTINNVNSTNRIREIAVQQASSHVKKHSTKAV